MMADQLRERLGETAIVENRTGADGRLAVRAVASSEPDGRTLLITPFGPVAIHPSVYSNLSYDPFKDLAPVAQVATFDFAAVVGPMAPVNSLEELVAWAKANPTQANFATPGAGTLPHFFGITFANAAGINLRHVPYRGTAPALTDLMGGQIPILFTTTADAVELHRAGRVKVLATSGAKRSPFTSDVPTFTEAGYGIQGEAWYGFFVRAGTPPEMVEKLNKALVEGVRSDAVRERLLKIGLVPTGTSPSELGAIQKADFERWAPVIKASGFKAQD
uniref:Putative exported protein n=1 Tax=uncultured bacterium esnapd21 TaxID=1366603 RepID=S5TN88_9BACT|nr:putative exported protein [uncultured bacterium esnapd21]